MTYKTVTQESYQKTAHEFARKVENLAPLESIEKFIKLLPSHAKIIDIGCGSGRDAKIFSERGLSVLGIDFCQNLIDIAKKHAPLAQFQMMDIETATFPPSSFDGAWACCSLSHISKKNFPSVLATIHSLLKTNGHLYLTLKKGIGEVQEKDLRYGDFEKFWSFYEEKEIKELVQKAHFEILEFSVVEINDKYQTHPSLRLFCKKRIINE